MIDINDIKQISILLNDKEITKYQLISDSFNINCVKIYLSNNQTMIAKYYSKKNNKFNAIISEMKNLKYLEEKKIKCFPSIILGNDKYLICFLKESTPDFFPQHKVHEDELICYLRLAP